MSEEKLKLSSEEESELVSESHSDPSRKKRSFTAEEWLKIRTLWELGDTTLRELGEMFDRNPVTLSQRFKREGIEKGSRKEEFEKRTQKELERDMNKNVGLKVKRANETKEEHYDWSRKISLLTMQTIARCMQDGNSLSTIRMDLATLKTASSILGDGQGQRNISVGLDKGDVVDEDQLPDLNVWEMTEAERIGVVEDATAKLKMQIDSDIDVDDDNMVISSGSDTDYEIASRMQQMRSIQDDQEELERLKRIPGNDV